MARKIAVLLLVALWPLSVRAQNLLTNPGFDGDLAGWITLSGSFSFNAEDADGGPPGSAEGSSSFEFGAFLRQCVGVMPGTVYEAGGMFRLISGGANTADIQVLTYPTVDCSGMSTDSSVLSGPLSSSWELYQDAFESAADAASASFWVGILGADSTFRMDDVFLIPAPFDDGFMSGDTTAWSGDSGYTGCAHNYCTEGGPLDVGCDDCVDAICASDPFCCGTLWDNVCVGLVESTCQETCSLTTCEHDVCQEGQAMTSGCDPCTTAICAADSFCCSDTWDSLCVANVEVICDLSCTYLSCDHSICLEGGPLDASCDSCVFDVCDADSFCCTVGWDDQCLAGVATVCGITCP